MKLFEIVDQYLPCPFLNSLEKRVLFHGTSAKFEKFERKTHGIYVTPIRSWAKMHYGSIIIPLYANITKMYKPTEEEIDLFYDVAYTEISVMLKHLSAQGYNGCMFGGESESIVLFNNVDMMHAVTGQQL